MAKEKKIKAKSTNENAVINEKNEQLVVTKKFSLTKFIIEILSAAMLIAFGILIFIKQNEAQFVVLLITGSVAVLGALLRIIPLLKTLQAKESKIISLVDILIHSLLGAYLIFSAFYFLNNPETKFSEVNNNLFHYFIAVLLYTRAIVYFWTTVIYKERTTKFSFWVHIAAITIAVVFAAWREISPKFIAFALAILAFICAVGISIDAGGGYFRYRKSIKNAVSKEDIQTAQEDKVEVPGVNEKDIIDEIDPKTIPVEEPQQESNIVS
ncbi:MAG: hypothetical protein J6R47_03140 [Acholeplasmatales bacterium]|nr:hypothetical protein [Acholeplasmatales bacterium]